MRIKLAALAIILILGVVSTTTYAEYERKEETTNINILSVQRQQSVAVTGKTMQTENLRKPSEYPDDNIQAVYDYTELNSRSYSYVVQWPAWNIIPDFRDINKTLFESAYPKDFNGDISLYYLVQFYSDKWSAEYEQMMRDNVQILEWRGDATYIVKIPEDTMKTKSYASVRWIDIIPAEKKISPALKELNQTKQIKALIIFFENTKEYADQLTNFGKINEANDVATIVETDFDNIQKIAELPFVKWIERTYEPQAYLDASTRVASTDITTLGNDASGISVGIVDSGIQHNHPHFNGITIYDAEDLVNGGSPEADPCQPGIYCPLTDHGTHIAGIISGNGNFQNRQLKGNSNKANLIIQRFMNGQGTWYGSPMINNTFWKPVLDPDGDQDYSEPSSADIISVSWGNGGSYEFISQKLDNITLGKETKGKQILFTVASGNSCNNPPDYTQILGLAKNVITVGASGDFRNVNNQEPQGVGPCGNPANADSLNLYVMSFSNRGSPLNFAMKPDILAPGSSVTSSNITSTYRAYAGTSMATPHVAAVAAQILKSWPEFYPATIKALILGRAVGGGTTNSPNINQAWGRLNAFRPLYIHPDDYRYSYRNHDQVGNQLSGYYSELIYNNITVPVGADRFIVTMVYSDDPAPVPPGDKTLVNDLDLYLEKPNGQILYNNDDDKNNVEKYIISNPGSGDWKVHVKKVSLNDNGGSIPKSVNYSLVFNIIKRTRTSFINITLTPSTSQPPVGQSFTLYADVKSQGLTSYDVWADIDLPADVTLISQAIDGTDADKDIIGDPVADYSKTTKQWALRGDTTGQKTITIHVRGKWIDDTSFDEVKTITIDVGGTNCDYDGDGHQSIQCGGDDCNDNNENVYPGHSELCDGIDNNCNNIVDEGCGGTECYDWTDSNPPPPHNQYFETISYGSYCASGRVWRIADIDNDGRNEHYMLVGETYSIWGYCKTKPGYTVADFIDYYNQISYGCADGACNEREENFHYSHTYTQPAVVYPISYPDMFCKVVDGYNWYSWGWLGDVLYDKSVNPWEAYLAVYCGVDADCPASQYCSKPYIGNPATFYCAPNTAPVVVDFTQYPTSLYRGQSMEIRCKVSDVETQPQNLNVTIEYQRGSEIGWNGCTNTWDAGNQWWECTKQTELTDNALDLWDFRCKVSDGMSESQWTIDVDTVFVLNNNPSFVTLPTQQLPEDDNGNQIYLELQLYSEDIEDGDPELSHSIESQSNTALIDCFISQQQFFTCSNPVANASGTSLINIGVADSDNGYNVSTIFINVTAVNDAPIISIISPEDDHIEWNTRNITFVYIPTDIDSSIQQCSLHAGNGTSHTMSFYTNWSSEQGTNGIYYRYHFGNYTWYDMNYSQTGDKWYAPNNPQARFWREAYQNIMFHPGTEGGLQYPYPALSWVVPEYGTYVLEGVVQCNFGNCNDGGDNDGFDINITVNGNKAASYPVNSPIPVTMSSTLVNLAPGDIISIIVESRLHSYYDWGSFTNLTIVGGISDTLETDEQIENNEPNIFTKILENGNYMWGIACFDNEEYGYSENRNLWVNIHHGGGKSLPYVQYDGDEI